jgi:hypothetical protein
MCVKRRQLCSSENKRIREAMEKVKSKQVSDKQKWTSVPLLDHGMQN